MINHMIFFNRACTGFDKILLNNFKVILAFFSSGERIDIQAFKFYCKEVAHRFVKLYPWYYMPTIFSAHQILPIGFFSEEAAVCSNKDVKKSREHHSR